MLSQSTALKELLLDKGLSPLSEASIQELARLQKLDVTGFTEADVRAEVIDPMLRILGYRKGEDSSVDREKHISFADKTSKYIDYSMTLWEKNFWLIEAKRPLSKDQFGYEELRQAVEYAVHPEINAALVVLCDGKKIEVFDREEDLVNPIYRISVADLAREFDKLRKLLSPMHVWFFYKRRIIRSIDRAFEHEVNQNRIVEFQGIVIRRLNEKRSQILENYRALKLSEIDQYGEQLKVASIDEIVDIHFFIDQSQSHIKTMIGSLVETCVQRSAFPVMYKIFPDEPRDVNDSFYMHALVFLMTLEKTSAYNNWLPAWLKKDEEGNGTRQAIVCLIRLCLSYFEQDASRKVVLLAANAYRRIFKLLAMLMPDQQRMAKVRHLLTRYSAPEFSWEQIISSPERHAILAWEQLTLFATAEFVRKHSLENHRFNTTLAEQGLRELWALESGLLGGVGDYSALLSAHNFGEIHSTEASSVVYDNLGHCCLCVLTQFPEWRDYVLAKHNNEVQLLARMGSWSARELLGHKVGEGTWEPLKLEEMANRFFYGDTDLLQKLSRGYGLMQ